MTTPADIIANMLRWQSGARGDYIGFGERAEQIVTALNAAGYQIVPKAERPSVCPTCGSDDPKVCAKGYMRPHQHGVLGDACCPHPWHGGAE